MARKERNRRMQEDEGFWDRPVLMNLVADVLIVFGVAVLLWAAVAGVKRLPFYPLREVVVVSDGTHVSRAQIEHAARTTLSGNLLSLNLDEARSAFEKLPWVRRAEVRRHWPDALELVIEEHVAAARWLRPDSNGDGRLVNTRGELFVATAADSGSEVLPAFSGPDGSSAAMLERLRDFDGRLATISRKPVELTLSARAAWQVRLDNGVIIDLGRDQPKLPLAERVDRFVTHFAAARDKAGIAVAAVDMRYPNGLVLRAGNAGMANRKS